MGRGCVKTSARFRTSLFRSLLRGLRAFRVEKIAKNLALLDRLQNVAEFLHGLGRKRPVAERKAIVSEGRTPDLQPSPEKDRSPRQSSHSVASMK